jgi:peptidoglycan/xylan/chitin deacetylase (PgdA/CDA1 family)
LKRTTTGGLVDGPVKAGIYNSLLGIKLTDADEYAAFQNGKAVYHDDLGDYSSNEPTMDGTASLSYLLSSLEAENSADKNVYDSEGAIIRRNPDEKKVYLVFSAHEYGEGGNAIARTLKRYKAKASFFFTGKYYDDPENKPFIEKLIADGQYVGAHSDAHLLYADWTKRDSSLVDRQKLTEDLEANYQKMAEFGITPEKAPVFLPPYEWYNAKSVYWSRQLGLNVVNFTPGIRSNADYTTPEMRNYRSSETILNDLKTFERNDPKGLNGCIVLIHLGTAPERTDKFYNRLGDLLNFLKQKGYETARF